MQLPTRTCRAKWSSEWFKKPNASARFEFQVKAHVTRLFYHHEKRIKSLCVCSHQAG